MTPSAAPTGLAAEVHLQRGDLALDAELTVAPGQVLAVVGPNGSGKSTLLRALAGLAPVAAGRIVLDGEVLDDPAAGVLVPPERRRIGVVFQDLLLFPHLRVLDAVAFGPRAGGASRAEARTRAAAWLERLGIDHLAQARPSALSGGQAQAVALARALATAPRLVLLDEPTTSLDPAATAEVRRSLRRHLRELDVPTVLVTHDPLDALALAEDALVLDEGQVVQAGPLAEVARRPRSRHVADLLGMNLLRGLADGHDVALAGGGRLTVAEPVRGEVLVLVRPAAVALHRHEPESSARNRWAVRVTGLEATGERVRVALDGPVPLVAEVTPAAVAELGLHEGAERWASVKATEVDAYPA